jgi:hypothetical protein
MKRQKFAAFSLLTLSIAAVVVTICPNQLNLDYSMEIRSAFSAGVQGLQRASSGITEATANINRDAVNQQRVRNAQDSAADATANSNRNDIASKQQPQTPSTTPSVTDSLVQLKTESNSASANVRAIRTADEMLGTLIDVSV